MLCGACSAMESLWTALRAPALRACPQASHSLGLRLETAAPSPHAPQRVISSISFMAVGVRLRLPSLALRKSLLERTYRKDWTQLPGPLSLVPEPFHLNSEPSFESHAFGGTRSVPPIHSESEISQIGFLSNNALEGPGSVPFALRCSVMNSCSASPGKKPDEEAMDQGSISGNPTSEATG
jgi:hypothetical protein